MIIARIGSFLRLLSLIGQLALVENCPLGSDADVPCTREVTETLETDPQFNSTVIVTTGRGRVQGFQLNYGDDARSIYRGSGRVFLGIPYARPPVGELRFKKPKSLRHFSKHMHDIYDATHYRPICPQDPAGLPPSKRDFPQSEDCLHLNIYAPSKQSGQAYPVMVYFHGGDFVGGSQFEISLSAALSQFAFNDVILVVVQYRVGVLGFFTAETKDLPPLRGLHDQVEALKWVRDEIANFGGDPNSVTICGHGAGAASVHAHTFSPLSKGLFHKTIMMSGTLASYWKFSYGDDMLQAKTAAQICNFTDYAALEFDGLVECLKSKSSNDFVNFLRSQGASISWKLFTDGNFLREFPSLAYMRRPHIPTLLGVTNCEACKFLRNESLSLAQFTREFFEKNFTYKIPGFAERRLVSKLLESAYVRDGENHAAWVNAFLEARSGLEVVSPVIREVEWQVNAGNENRIYLYEFAYSSPVHNAQNAQLLAKNDSLVPHGADIALLFIQEEIWKSKELEQADVQMIHQLAEWITNFVKEGHPGNGFEGGNFDRSSGTIPYFQISENPSMKEDFHPLDHFLWNKPSGLHRFVKHYQPPNF